ncbi:MAG: DnaA regulatory inactivator Hda [Gammaproteobacteria bacterium]|nr:DnaA regulatory inactivator Hda [Gammaproteobacteria bacterium]MAY02147.1 DnaA regulatory inactivator Hda [Gammaproteobacteria bacterium]|tara:strand:- start:103595 stop:104281 length:687 start_codon:yes stop_codon:yes gene_type:complete
MSLSPQATFDFHLRKEFSFDNFICMVANRELFTQLSTDALPNQFYFIWGRPGSGKSHILQALCGGFENAVYLPLKELSRHGEGILDGLEQLDLICIDDIQQVISSPAWEARLFKLFNDVQQDSTSHLIISSDQAPAALDYALPDLKSRFSSGMVYQLHELDEAGKLEALKKRAASVGMPLDDDVLQYICSRTERSTHHLFNVLEELEKLSLSEKRKLTIPFVKSLMHW